MVDAALALAAEGFPVFPCHTPRAHGGCSCARAECESIGKHPRTLHGLKEATRDEATIREWWRKWPDANVAIATGGGLVVLDVDVHKDGSSAGLELPDTRRVVTGSGGEHWYMRADGPVGNSCQLIGPGLDVRGDGGYVLAPPSLHECGRRYAWDAGSAGAIAPAPEWFLRMVRQKRSAGANGKAGPDAFVSHGRNTAMTQYAGSMRRRGFTPEAILAALLAENAARCRPPMDEAEVTRIARGMKRYDPSDPVNPMEWRVLTGAALATPLPPIPWLCRELGVAPGAITLVAGSSHAGKTMALQALGVAVATGGALWGRFAIEAGPVLHVDFEQGERVTRLRYMRMALACGAWMGLWDNLTVVPLPPAHLDADGSLEVLERLCVGKRVCVIDSLRAAWPKADENSSDVRKWLDALLPVSERTGCVFIVIHHTRKVSKDQLGGTKMMIRGSSAIADAAESIFSIVETGVQGQCMVHHDKARLTGKRLDPFTLTTADVSYPVEQFAADIASATLGDLSANETGSLRFGLEVVAAGVDPSATLEARIVQFVERHPSCGLTEIREGVAGRGVEIDQTVKRMVRDGILNQRVGFRGKMIHDVATREPGEDFDEWN